MTFDRPPRESYVRVTREVSGFTLEPAVEYRDGDDYHAITQKPYAICDGIVRGLRQPMPRNGLDAMDVAKSVADTIATGWPGRAYFVEVWQDGTEGFAQVFQPFGLPRNRP